MAEGRTKSEDIKVNAREVDFTTRFGLNWKALMYLMGIMRAIKKAPGTVLKYKYAEGALEEAQTAEGEAVTFTKFEVKTKDYGEITLERYAKSVTDKAIIEHGYDNAVALTDNQFLFELTQKVTSKFYTYLNTGNLEVTAKTFLEGMAKAKGAILNKFKQMHRDVTEVVAFVNVIDAYNYLGSEASLSIQTQFGMSYLQNFLGYRTVFLCSDDEVTQGTILATPIENLNLYYVDPSDPELQRADLVYTTDGVTNLIGFHTSGDYVHSTSDCFAIMGMDLFAEYLDGIAKVTVSPGE